MGQKQTGEDRPKNFTSSATKQGSEAEPVHKHLLGFKQTYCLKVLELHQSLLVHHHGSLELAVESLLYSPVGGHPLQGEESRR